MFRKSIDLLLLSFYNVHATCCSFDATIVSLSAFTCTLVLHCLQSHGNRCASPTNRWNLFLTNNFNGNQLHNLHTNARNESMGTEKHDTFPETEKANARVGERKKPCKIKLNHFFPCYVVELTTAEKNLEHATQIRHNRIPIEQCIQFTLCR